MKPAPSQQLNRPAHPLALQLWTSLTDRSEADQRLVLRALQIRLEVGPTTENQELALRALKLAHDSKDTTAERVYRAWRKEQADPLAFPSADFVRRAFGGWAHAEAAFSGRPVSDTTALRLKTSGREIKPETIEAAIVAWAGETDPNEPLTISAFIKWCREKTDKGNLPLGHLPRSVVPVYSKFGRWEPLLVRLGLGHRLRAALMGPPPMLASAIDLSEAPLADRYPMTDEGMIRWLQWIATLLAPAESMSLDRHTELTRAVRAHAIAQGMAIDVPCATTYTERWGSWAATRQAAGLDRPSKTTRYTTAEIEDAVEAAIRLFGPGVSTSEYQRWRRKQVAEGQPGTRLPDIAVVYVALGGPSRQWPIAIESVLQSRFGMSELEAVNQRRAGQKRRPSGEPSHAARRADQAGPGAGQEVSR